MDPNNPDSPYQKHLRAFKQELELQPQKRPELGDISLIQPKDFESFEQYPALLTKIANYWYDEAARLTNERNHARTIATQLQNKFGELASKLSLYQQSSSGLRYVENKNKQSQPGLQNQEHSPKRRKLCAPLEEVQKYCRKHEIKSKRQYQDACKKRDFSEVFPRSRADEYHGVSWNLVLGKEE